MGTQIEEENIGKEKLLVPITDVLSALAHPVRLRILFLLHRKGKYSKEGQCVCEISETLKLPQALVSQHLAILRRSWLVKTKRMGNKILYSLSDCRIHELLNIVQAIVSDRLKEILSSEGGE